MDQNKDKINLLKKLKELSERGVGGEKIEAAKLLDKLLKKYNLSETELGAEDIKEIELTFKGAEEETLLLQVCYKVFGKTEAVLKGIQALTEKMLRQAKAEQLKKQYKNKCRDCEQFSFGDGGLNPCYGNCALKDPPFDYTRKASNRACKCFVKDNEEV